MASGPSQQPEEDPEDFSQRLHILYHPLPYLRRDIAPLHDLLSLFAIISLIRREQPTLLHTHTTKAGILGRIAGRVTRTKTIHTPHGHLFYGYFGKGKERLYVFLEQLAARFCERIITISEDERREYLKKGIGDEHKVVTIYNGIDIKRFPGDGKKLRAELGITQEVPLVGYVGRMEGIKGPDRFVKAAQTIKATSPKTHFVMVGDGPMKEGLMKMTRGISDLHFLGYREHIPDLVAAFDIMLIPSLNDGFNLAAVEALASSIPVIATAVGGLPEVVGDGGIFVGPGDTTRMAQEAVALLNSSRLKKELGTKGRKRAEALFDWSICLQRTIDLYHEVAGEIQ